VNKCQGTLEAKCNNYNWAECPNLDKSNMIYTCGINPYTYDYDEDKNTCIQIQGTSGKYESYKECSSKNVKEYNFLKNWHCKNVSNEITGNPITDPAYVTPEECRTKSQLICKGLTSSDPKQRAHSISLLQTAEGRTLLEMDCGCYLKN
jgi:hypothetical protein